MAAGGAPVRKLLVWLGLGLFLAAWVAADPPGAPPDEPAHYVKAMATDHGELLGSAGTRQGSTASPRDRLLATDTRHLPLPVAQRPDRRWACEAFTPHSAACTRAAAPPADDPYLTSQRPYLASTRGGIGTYVGVYPPFAYAPLGVGALIGAHADQALYLGRIASALICFLLLGIAVAFCGEGWTQLGLLAATSPMVLFLAGSLNPSGIELCAGIALAAVTVTLARGDDRRAVWAAFAVSGLVLAITRPFGPLWVAFDVVVLGLLVGRTRLRQLLLANGRAPLAASALVTVGAAVMVAWDALLMPSLGQSPGTIVAGVRQLPGHVSPVLHQMYGVFGWVEISPPRVATYLAWLFYALVVGAGVVAGTPRVRRVIAVSVAGLVVVSAAIDLVTQIPYDYNVQGRYIMPMTAMVFLLCGHAADQRLGAAPPLRLTRRVVAAGLGVLLTVGWYASSQRAAVGASGPTLFFRHPAWSPPGGWPLWLAAVAVATVLVVVGSVGSKPRERGPRYRAMGRRGAPPAQAAARP